MTHPENKKRFWLWILAGVTAVLLAVVGGWYGYAQHTDKPGTATSDKAAPPVQHYQLGDRLQANVSPKETQETPDAKAATYREITWDDLLPKNWNPMLAVKRLNLENMDDNDPRAAKALDKIREIWKNAPVRTDMDKQLVKIPGFVVSLDREGEAIKEFLLVPNFGGCIHVPPPPANQIIHVTALKAYPNIRTMDAVWVTGTLTVNRSDTALGTAGYSLRADSVQMYRFHAEKEQ